MPDIPVTSLRFGDVITTQRGPRKVLRVVARTDGSATVVFADARHPHTISCGGVWDHARNYTVCRIDPSPAA